MSEFLPEDKAIANFLREHRPTAPPPKADLEEQILGAIELRNIESTPAVDFSRWQRRTIKIAGGIAASVILNFVGYRFFTPAPVSVSNAELDEFIESSWNGLLTERNEPEWYF